MSVSMLVVSGTVGLSVLYDFRINFSKFQRSSAVDSQSCYFVRVVWVEFTFWGEYVHVLVVV